MRGFVLPVTLAAALAACAPPTDPGNRDTGIAAWDRSSRTLWINGRESYSVPAGTPTNGMMNGDTVTVTWKPEGGERVASRISVDRRRDENDR